MMITFNIQQAKAYDFDHDYDFNDVLNCIMRIDPKLAHFTRITKVMYEGVRWKDGYQQIDVMTRIYPKCTAEAKLKRANKEKSTK